jgi:hypothetical protein
MSGKGGQCAGLTLPPSCVDSLEILGDASSWNPNGTSSPVQELLYLDVLQDRMVIIGCIST